MENLNNNSHIMEFVNRSRRTLGNDFMNLYKDPNERGSNGCVSGKRMG